MTRLELLRRMAELSNMTDYPRDYALQWWRLAEQFEGAGMPATAESCRDRAIHYWDEWRSSGVQAAAPEAERAPRG